MRIAVTGSSGLVGSHLVPELESRSDQVIRLVRSHPANTPNTVYWNPAVGEIDKDALDGVNAIINLAGENIGGGRWSKSRKERIVNSRLQSTKLLCDTIVALDNPPSTIISASAIGYYGNRGDELLTEESTRGTGFLSELCAGWEDALSPAVSKGRRVVFLRIGVVLTPDGGALAKMLPLFKAGLGGRLGSGSQYMSWLSLEDLIGIILFALDNPALAGPVNAVAPNPVTNREFTHSLGRTLRRPTLFPVPAPVLRLMLGEMADETVLSSGRAVPRALEKHGYQFTHPDLNAALKSALG